MTSPVRDPEPTVVGAAPAPTGELAVSAGGWKLAIPAGVLLAIASAVGARMLPTPTATDTGIAELRTQMQIRELRDEQFRSEVRTELRAIREGSERSADELRNRIGALETRLRQ